MRHKKVVIVTGGFSGIGETTSEVLERAGYEVIRTTSRRAGAGKEGGRVLDLGDDRSIAEFCAGLEGRPIQGLVNNGALYHRRAIGELEFDEVDRLFDVNIVGVMKLVSRLIENLKRSKDGARIVSISSVLGRAGRPGFSAYCA